MDLVEAIIRFPNIQLPKKARQGKRDSDAGQFSLKRTAYFFFAGFFTGAALTAFAGAFAGALVTGFEATFAGAFAAGLAGAFVGAFATGLDAAFAGAGFAAGFAGALGAGFAVGFAFAFAGDFCVGFAAGFAEGVLAAGFAAADVFLSVFAMFLTLSVRVGKKLRTAQD